ncbi:MAG: hypothetical protein U0169_01995 [Polyangiaceae bacterium]
MHRSFHRSALLATVFALSACNSIVNRQVGVIVGDVDDGGVVGVDASGSVDSSAIEPTGPSVDASAAGVDANSPRDGGGNVESGASDSGASDSGVPDGPGTDAGASESGAGDAGVVVETIADDESQAEALTVVGSRVVWCNNGSSVLRGCDGDACTPVDLVTSPQTTNGLTNDGTNALWGNFAAGEILSLPMAGSAAGPTQVMVNEPYPSEVTRDGDTLAWRISRTDDTIRACTLSACAATAHDVVTAPSIRSGFSLSAGNVYWHGTTGALFECPVTGCGGAPRQLSALDGYGVVVRAGHAIFVTRTPVAIVRCPVSDCSHPTTVGTSYSPGEVTTDGRDVYWTNGLYRQLLHCPVTGCSGAPEILYGNLRSGDVSAIALTPEWVYFSTSFEIRRVRR